jgi:hypothetical protein
LTYKFSDSPATLRRATAIARKLMDEADALLATDSTEIHRQHDEVFLAMFGWWRMVVRSSRALWALNGQGYTIEAAPIMRNIVDHTLAMVWLADVGKDGLTALEVMAHWSREQTIERAKINNWTIPPEVLQVAPPVQPGDPDEKKYNALVGEFVNFSNRVDAFAIPDMYVVYQYLSRYSHSSAYTAHPYIQRMDDGTIRLRGTAPSQGNADLIWSAVSLIQAGHAISPMMIGDPLRKTLDKAAKDLGVSSPATVYPVRRPKKTKGPAPKSAA